MRRARIESRALAALAGVCGALATGCGGDAPGKAIDEAADDVRTACLYGGAANPGELSFSAAELDSLGDLSVTSGDQDSLHSAACSGSLVAEQWLLTSAHCTVSSDSTHVSVRLGAPAGCGTPPPRVIDSAQVVVSPTLDLMLVRLTEPAATPAFPVTPLLLDTASDLSPGERVYLAGFGRTEARPHGDLRFTAESISAVNEESIVVDGLGESGACTGDSGGPLLRRDASGTLTTLGVLSHGSATCVGSDSYVRLRAASAWLAETLGAL